jgi:hypothetical protein
MRDLLTRVRDSRIRTPSLACNPICSFFSAKSVLFLWIIRWKIKIVSNQTTREIIAKLLKRRDELRLESEALDNMIQTYQRLAMIEKTPDPDQLSLWRGENSRAAKSAYVSEILSEVRRIIIGEGKPMSRSELVRRLEAEGYVLDGRDKAKVLGTNIWRSEQFMHVEGQGYWPADIPLILRV